MDFFSLYSYGKRCASKWLILCIIFSCADTEIYFRRLLPKQKVIWQMNHTAMNNSIWTTNSQSLSDFEFSHFCRYFPFLFDSCAHILLKGPSKVGHFAWGCHIYRTAGIFTCCPQVLSAIAQRHYWDRRRIIQIEASMFPLNLLNRNMTRKCWLCWGWTIK